MEVGAFRPAGGGNDNNVEVHKNNRPEAEMNECQPNAWCPPVLLNTRQNVRVQFVQDRFVSEMYSNPPKNGAL